MLAPLNATPNSPQRIRPVGCIKPYAAQVFLDATPVRQVIGHLIAVEYRRMTRRVQRHTMFGRLRAKRLRTSIHRQAIDKGASVIVAEREQKDRGSGLVVENTPYRGLLILCRLYGIQRQLKTGGSDGHKRQDHDDILISNL